MAAELDAKPLILHWIWSLSLGGDAKNACALAVEQSKWARVVVLTRLPDTGVRAKDLRMNDIEVTGGIDSATQVESLLGQLGQTPIAMIMHRNGRPDVVETQVLERFQRITPCIEFSTFGRVDAATDELWSGHLFPSRSCLVQYSQRRNRTVAQLTRHWAVGYAMNLPPAIDAEERLAARQKLGLAEHDFVALRLQRPDLRKWDPLPILAIRRLVDRSEHIKIIVQAAPPQRTAWLRDTLGDAAILLDPAEDQAVVRQTLAASDCFLNYSHIGETFGLAMAEAMSCGIPPLTNSTPHMDNAQVEICTHGQNGLVANTLEGLCSALELLIKDPPYRLKLGSAAREFIASTFSAQAVERRVRRRLLEILSMRKETGANGVPGVADDDNYQLDEFWLNDLPRRTVLEHQFKGSPGQQMLDAQYVRFLRARDTFDYAAAIGPGQILDVIARRIKRASLKRD